MLNNVYIREDLTFTKFAYNSKSLSKKSNKYVIAECEHCHALIDREFRHIERRHQCPIIAGNQKRCFKCSQWKDLSFFNKSKNLSGGVATLCRSCYNKYDCVKKYEINKNNLKKTAFKENFNLYLQCRLNSLKSKSKKKSINFNLDMEDLINQWNLQNGLCYYSGLIMKSEGNASGFQVWQRPSIDKKIPSMGYTKGNIVWCCFSINAFKQDLTDVEFYEKLKTINWNIQ
jgi:hypothetical protein